MRALAASLTLAALLLAAPLAIAPDGAGGCNARHPCPTPTPTVAPTPTPTPAPTPTPTLAPTPTPTAPPAGFSFAEEFSGTTLPTAFGHRYNCCGSTTMDRTLSSVSGGYLHQRVELRNGVWYADIVDTTASFTQQYGKFEASIKVPQGAGLWPAFWLYTGTFGTDGDEIDIAELLGAEQMQCAHQTVHKGTQANQVYNPWAACLPPGGGNWADGQFHTYAVDWRPTYIAFSIDGRETWRETSLLIAKPLGVLLNMGVGGWGGTPAASSSGAEMLVDWVHVSP